MKDKQYNDTGASYLSGDLEGQLDEIEVPLNTEASDTPARQGMSRGKRIGLYVAGGVSALALTTALIGRTIIYNHCSKGVCPPIYKGITEIKQSE